VWSATSERRADRRADEVCTHTHSLQLWAQTRARPRGAV